VPLYSLSALIMPLLKPLTPPPFLLLPFPHMTYLYVHILTPLQLRGVLQMILATGIVWHIDIRQNFRQLDIRQDEC